MTAEPWTLTRDAVQDAASEGLDEKQLEIAIGVISMFNYFTRVADATGIEFDYPTPLPAFEPDKDQVAATRPDHRGFSGQPAGRRRRPADERLQAAWESWRSYVLDTEEPLSRRERSLLASVAARESGDWEGAEALNGREDLSDGDDPLIEFARKLSRQPWQMEEGDLESLRAADYSETAILHVISVVAHQNADSRLALGLTAAAS